MWGKVMDEVKDMKNAFQHKIDQLQDEMKKKMVEVWEMVG
jgi:gas vesicle protein